MMMDDEIAWDGREYEFTADEKAILLLEDKLGRPLRRGQWYERVCGEDACANPAHLQLVSKRGARGDVAGADAARKTCDATADIAINHMLFSPDGEFALPHGSPMPETAEQVELEAAAHPCLQAGCVIKVGDETTPHRATAEVTLLGTKPHGLLRAVAYVPHLAGNRGDVFMRESLYRSFKRSLTRRFGAKPRTRRRMGACERKHCMWMGDHVLGFRAVDLFACACNLRIELCSTRFHTDVMGHDVQHHV